PTRSATPKNHCQGGVVMIGVLVAEQTHRAVAIFIDPRASGETTMTDALITTGYWSIKIRRVDCKAIHFDAVAGAESILANGAGCQQQQGTHNDETHGPSPCFPHFPMSAIPLASMLPHTTNLARKQWSPMDMGSH